MDVLISDKKEEVLGCLLYEKSWKIYDSTTKDGFTVG